MAYCDANQGSYPEWAAGGDYGGNNYASAPYWDSLLYPYIYNVPDKFNYVQNGGNVPKNNLATLGKATVYLCPSITVEQYINIPNPLTMAVNTWRSYALNGEIGGYDPSLSLPNGLNGLPGPLGPNSIAYDVPKLGKVRHSTQVMLFCEMAAAWPLGETATLDNVEFDGIVNRDLDYNGGNDDTAGTPPASEVPSLLPWGENYQYPVHNVIYPGGVPITTVPWANTIRQQTGLVNICFADGHVESRTLNLTGTALTGDNYGQFNPISNVYAYPYIP